jgi:DMSO/TMAO reductase YedYZ molybdopterin-dependent catalytic subunit
VLVAYAMNGSDLPREHGAPARLIVPAWYGVASVKWLAEIVALEQPFRGFYQADRYVINEQPIREMKPRAVIVSPVDGEIIQMSLVTVRGFAWSGGSPVEAIALSIDDGRSWSEIEPEPGLSAHAWRSWQITIQPRQRGPLSLRARAICADGTRQPLEPFRSDLGYCNNATQPVRIEIA